mgnify:CR=1 FL=1
MSGWFLEENGVAKIDVLVDGKAAGQGIYGDVRLDVQKAYPKYNNGKSGFHFPLDSTKFSNENILLQLGKLERMALSRHYQYNSNIKVLKKYY